MNAVKILSIILISLPATIALMGTFANFRLYDFYLLAGIISLFTIVFADRFQWFGTALVYIPAFWCFYLLIFVGNPRPFISLAAGYVIALPIIMLISTLTTRSMWRLIGGYVISYSMALTLYIAALNGFNTPEKLFIYIVRVFSQYVARTEGLNLLPPVGGEDVDPALLATPTALATIGLLLNVMSKDQSSAMKSRIELTGDGVKALLISLALAAVASYASMLSVNLSAYVVLAIGAAVLLVACVSSRLGGGRG